MFGKRAVGAPAHGDVIVDVDELAGEALREKSGDEQRHVAQRCKPRLRSRRGRRLERLGQHDHQRLEARARRRSLVERFGTGEQRQQVDDVVLGLVLDRQMLFRERAVQRVAEELPQIRHRYETWASGGFGHGARISFFIINGTRRLKFTPPCDKIP